MRAFRSFWNARRNATTRREDITPNETIEATCDEEGDGEVPFFGFKSVLQFCSLFCDDFLINPLEEDFGLGQLVAGGNGFRLPGKVEPKPVRNLLGGEGEYGSEECGEIGDDLHADIKRVLALFGIGSPCDPRLLSIKEFVRKMDEVEDFRDRIAEVSGLDLRADGGVKPWDDGKNCITGKTSAFYARHACTCCARHGGVP